MSAFSAERLADFYAALAPRVNGSFRTDAMTRALYATDASLYQMMPVAVLVPRHAEEVQAAVETARRFGVPVLPRGGGSSLAGQTVGEALVIDFSRHLNGILEVNPEERWARVQPGLVLDRFNRALARHGLMMGPDPASGNRATLGGMMANNSTGTHSILYGNFIHHLRAARVFLDDGSAADLSALDADAWLRRREWPGREGEIYRAIDALLAEKAAVIERDTPEHWRRNNGYRIEHLLEDRPRNLGRLLCGSEGTLAIATELTLDLVPMPTRTAVGVVHFHTRAQALRAVTAVLETGPSAVELFDGEALERCRAAPAFAARLTFVEGEPGGLLLTEYYGETDAELDDRLATLRDRTAALDGCFGVVPARTPTEVGNVWGVRKEALGLIMNVKGDHKPVAFLEDASVPVEHLADYIDELVRLFDATGTRAVLYAHASAGCLHVRPFINTKDAAEVEKMRELAFGSMELVRKYGGYVSSEHGDGLARSWLIEPLLGPALTDVYREVKHIFDPENVFNPGKIIDAPPMTENLRLSPGYASLPLLTDQDFSADGGLSRAVELCNGNGACRKLDGGTMCPSFMVTREEKDSTRGRANALRMAMSGALPPEALTSEALYDVMDLCIECKACKTECPSNVDMGKLKTEWLAHYWAANPMPLRTKLFAHLPRVARRLGGMAGLANWANRLQPTRWLLDRALGICDQRRIPRFARTPFTTWFKRQTWNPAGPPVVLFPDTFHNYQHPEVAHAAARFLDRVGFRVVLPEKPVCCGRTFLSKGLVTEAQIEALTTVDRLYPFVEAGMPVIGLEPSCILTLSDEFRTLIPGDPRAAAVAEAAITFEAFVARHAEAGGFDGIRWKEGGQHHLLHGHCHQKALVGTEPAVRALSVPPGHTVEVVDSGCCGMAGAFGYEREHYDISLAMAERRLAPAVRAAAEDTVIVAAGTSCRAQIHDAANRVAQHPAEVLWEALARE